MKTLVIHPKDDSTDFLCPIYESIECKTILRSGLSKNEVAEQISVHDRIIMLGHGSPNGLFAVGQFICGNSYIIDNSLVKLLAEKDENVYIWCHANKFVENSNLRGFYTGMFVSEILEAIYCDLPIVDQKVVDESNNEFSRIVSRYINHSKSAIYKNVLEDYQDIAAKNLIAGYNLKRIYKN